MGRRHRRRVANKAGSTPEPPIAPAEKLGHAIAFLNNHVPIVTYTGDPEDRDEGWRGNPPALALLPEDVRGPLVRALVAAAGHVERSFSTPEDDRP